MAEPPSLVVSSSAGRQEEAITFCTTFQFSYIPWQELPPPNRDLFYVLNFSDHRVEVLSWVSQGPGAVYVDFETGKMAHRRKFGRGKGELIAKAVGLKNSTRTLHVIDATAGLGGDAWVLASLGCQMTLFERHPIAYCLLHDGLERVRCSDNDELRAILSRVTLHFGRANFTGDMDVIYLDPMFPERTKRSSVKKEMSLFQALVGEDLDAAELLLAAQQSIAKRVVVKRPRLAADLAGMKPSHRIVGKSSRFDVYARESII